MGSEIAVLTEGSGKCFGNTQALSGVDLSVKSGTIFALLGRNGAGKTTAIRILATLIRPDEGKAQVNSLDVVKQADELRYQIGLTGQFTAVDESLTGRENLEMFGRLYGLRKKYARIRADELIERFGLSEAASKPAKTYSGGLRRRLDLAAALLLFPRVLFLDEPTTGLDPASRIVLWEFVRQLVSQGTTIVLTTQYLEEADQLADQIAFIDRGRIIARGTPAELKDAHGNARLEMIVGKNSERDTVVQCLKHVALGEISIDRERCLITLNIAEQEGIISSIVRRLDHAGIPVNRLTMHKPTLDEVFLSLTGYPDQKSGNLTSANSKGEDLLCR